MGATSQIPVADRRPQRNRLVIERHLPVGWREGRYNFLAANNCGRLCCIPLRRRAPPDRGPAECAARTGVRDESAASLLSAITIQQHVAVDRVGLRSA